MPLLIHTYLRIPGPAGQTKYGSVYIERERDAEELSDRDITAPKVAARHLRDTSRILPTDGISPSVLCGFPSLSFPAPPWPPACHTGGIQTITFRRQGSNPRITLCARVWSGVEGRQVWERGRDFTSWYDNCIRGRRKYTSKFP